MRANRLNKEDLKQVCQVMSVGNTALKECAVMMDMNQREFRGKLFGNKLDTNKLSTEQIEKLNAAKPLIFAVRDQCEEKVRNNFRRLITQQAWLAARNSYDSTNAKEEFMQEGDIAVLDGVYGYTLDKRAALCSYIWHCIRRRIFDAVNRLNPLCPLTNEALDLVHRVHEIQDENSDITDAQAAEILGFTDEEREIFFRSITKVVNEQWQSVNTPSISQQEALGHADDYTAKRKGADNDFKEVFFIRKEARQAVKDANLNDFELACVFGDTFPYHGWKEDVASKHINPRTGERFTRQNVQYTLARAKDKIKKAYLNPPEVYLENPVVDKFFDEWNPERAVEEDQRSKK